MDNSFIDLKFEGKTAAELEEKIKPAIEMFELSAKYEDGVCRVFGPQSTLDKIFNAYLLQWMRKHGTQAVHLNT